MRNKTTPTAKKYAYVSQLVSRTAPTVHFKVVLAMTLQITAQGAVKKETRRCKYLRANSEHCLRSHSTGKRAPYIFGYRQINFSER
jgi:hypothetical protein